MVAILQTLSDGRVRKVAPEGAGSFELDGTWPDEDLAAQGYLRFGKRAVRADLAERLGWELSKRRKEAEKATFEIPPELASVVSCPLDDFHNVLKGFGIAPAEKDPETGAVKLWRFQSRARLEEQKQRRENRPPRKPRGDAKSGDRPPSQKGGKRRDGDQKSGNRPQGNRPRHQGGNRRPPEKKADPNSPFAALAALLPPPPAAPAPKKKKRKPKPKKPAVAANSTETVAEAAANPTQIAENPAQIVDKSPPETAPNSKE